MRTVTYAPTDWDTQPPRGWRLGLANWNYRMRRIFGRRARALEKKPFRPSPTAQPLFSFAVLGSALTFGMVEGGHSKIFADQASAFLGFGIEEVRIAGLDETNQTEVLLALDRLGVASLPMMNSGAAQQALLQLPWVETASVSKLYPDILAVNLTEKQPVARWQRGRNSAVSVIDQFGQVITQQLSPDLMHLPLVVGDGAEYQVAEITNYLRAAGWLRSRIYAAVLVSERRWNLVTHEGIIIRLPEHRIEAALSRLEQQEREQQLLDKNLRVIDLRFADQVVVRLAPAETAAREPKVSAPATKL